MKAGLFIGLTALTIACSSEPQNREVSSAGGPPSGPAATDSANRTGERATDRAVTLVGCLRGPSLGGETAGTSGSNRTPPGAPESSQATAPSSRFTLINAAAAAPGTAGIGANGAGASGGPLVSGASSYDLDGLAADAAAHVNKQVKITGEIDTNPATLVGPSTAPRERTGETGAGSGRATPSATGGTGGGHGQSGSAAETGTLDSANRRVVVSSVEVVSETCPRR